MIDPEVKDLIQEIWEECEQDLNQVADALCDGAYLRPIGVEDELLVEQAANEVQYILKNGIDNDPTI